MKKITGKKDQCTARLIRNQLTSLVLYENITTTSSKAKTLKSEAQSLIAMVKKEQEPWELIRKVNKILYGGAVRKIIDKKDDFTSVSIIKSSNRFGDGVQKSIVILNSKEKKLEKKAKTTEKKEASK